MDVERQVAPRPWASRWSERCLWAGPCDSPRCPPPRAPGSCAQASPCPLQGARARLPSRGSVWHQPPRQAPPLALGTQEKWDPQRQHRMTGYSLGWHR